MLPYYLFFGFLFCISFFDLIKNDIQSKEKVEKILFFILWLVLIFFIGFRYKMANDWYNYENLVKQVEPLNEVLFGNTPNFRSLQDVEYGFRILLSTVNLFFDPDEGSLQALTVFVSIFCYTVLLNFTRKQAIIPYKFIFLSVFISLSIFREFDVLRQSIALYIFLLSIKYFNNSFIKYSLLNLVGAMFHVSAIIFIPLYFLFRLKFSRPAIFVILALYMFSMVTRFSIVTSLISFLSNYFPELVLVRKLYFTSFEFETAGSFSVVGVVYGIFLLLLFFNYKKIDFSNYKIRLLINAFFIFIILNFLFSDSKEVADRLSYYFYIGLAFVFVYSIQFIPKTVILPYMILIMAFPAIRFLRVLSNPMTAIVNIPYRNFLFRTPDDDDTILKNWQEKSTK